MNTTTTPGPKGRRFFLGALRTTPGARDALETAGVTATALLSRHVRGDWGTVDRHDAAANDDAVKHGDRILSSYLIGADVKVWVITEADRSATTILLPEDY